MHDLFKTDTGATFSPCRVYRYELWRLWNKCGSPLVFIGLNPSTADETLNDPTIRRCIGFAHREGCGSFVMLNLFGLRSTDPKGLRTVDDPIGPRNDETIGRWLKRPDARIVAAWGAHPFAVDRAAAVASMALWVGVPLSCLGTTKDGAPRHPLYVRGDAPLVSWWAPKAVALKGD